MKELLDKVKMNERLTKVCPGRDSAVHGERTRKPPPPHPHPTPFT